MALGTLVKLGDGKASITTVCPFCMENNPPVVVEGDSWHAYAMGEISALDLTGNKDIAEYLISGCCIPCWERICKRMGEDI